MKHHGLKIASVVTGLLVITAGVLLFLFNAGVLDSAYRPVIFSWQMLLIAIGFNGLFSHRSWFFSIALMMVGGFFLLQNLDVPGMVFVNQNLWTILLIFAGLLILSRAIFGKNRFYCRSKRFRRRMEEKDWCDSNNWGKHKGEAGYLDLNYVFSGANEKLSMEVFRGGEINCVFGGLELDFYDCQLAEGISSLEINTVFGGAVLYIPKEWNVEIRANQVFGNFADNRPKPDFEIDKTRLLIINASSVFGGGEIKCK
jgi:predicted membrane protein